MDFVLKVVIAGNRQADVHKSIPGISLTAMDIDDEIIADVVLSNDFFPRHRDRLT